MAEIMFRFFDNNSWHAGIAPNGLPYWVESADMLFPRPLKALAHSMRGFIRAPYGTTIISADYSQIEARVLAWLAQCNTLLKSYATGEDVYVRFAADHMYRRKYSDYFGPQGKILPAYTDERQRAKSAVLGCGFGLGPPGFQEYCDNMDIIIDVQEAERTIKAYRSAYPEISDWNTGLWSRVNYCAIAAVENEGQTFTVWGTQVTYHVYRIDSERWWLICTLPSGRHIAYYRPKTDTVNQWGRPALTYRTEWMGKTFREQTYGGKLTENIVQAIARDIMCIGALNVRALGFNIFALIHDEIVMLLSLALGISEEEAKIAVKQALLDLPGWCAGLPLDAEVKAMDRYSK
jgi:DNA polymerase